MATCDPPAGFPTDTFFSCLRASHCVQEIVQHFLDEGQTRAREVGERSVSQLACVLSSSPSELSASLVCRPVVGIQGL